MALVAPTEGKIRMLQSICNNVASEALTLGLFTNNYTPVAGSILSNFTACTITGYAAIALTPATWVTSGNPITYPQQTFTFTGGFGATIYGYYIYGASKCYWAELLTVPFVPANNGDNLKITLQLTLS